MIMIWSGGKEVQWLLFIYLYFYLFIILFIYKFWGLYREEGASSCTLPVIGNNTNQMHHLRHHLVFQLLV